MNQLVYLRTFLDAYRSGSLTRAATRLGITQPAASAHIQSLENTFGKALFTRQARGVAPTAAADDLARAIAPHLDALEASFDTLRLRSGSVQGTVHIAGPAEFLSVRLVPMILPLQVHGLKFRLQTGNRNRIRTLLDDGAVDLAITTSKPDNATHGHVEIGRERLLLVAAPEIARQMKGRSLTAAFLRELPCLAYDEHLPLVREFIEAVFNETPLYQAAVTAPDLRLLANGVATGAGWSVLPDYIAADYIATGRMAELPTIRPGPENLLYLVWNKGALRQPRVAYVRDHIVVSASQFASDGQG
ncbi:LysR family transcriptional regulator [Ensifer sp. YR511]|uniref:LysR family transcriptional regulator n=1 Tax=Ensifer sp. YR511 TaxID=1855294 RepID=UPI00087E2F85|nr:LysR family transcriptional regulator [Ensifer sp. YR511]SDN03268.1 DNA-binding transcriptional regulator, LysR family [Ensifer sp. YR511]